MAQDSTIHPGSGGITIPDPGRGDLICYTTLGMDGDLAWTTIWDGSTSGWIGMDGLAAGGDRETIIPSAGDGGLDGDSGTGLMASMEEARGSVATSTCMRTTIFTEAGREFMNTTGLFGRDLVEVSGALVAQPSAIGGAMSINGTSAVNGKTVRAGRTSDQ